MTSIQYFLLAHFDVFEKYIFQHKHLNTNIFSWEQALRPRSLYLIHIFKVVLKELNFREKLKLERIHIIYYEMTKSIRLLFSVVKNQVLCRHRCPWVPPISTLDAKIYSKL